MISLNRFNTSIWLYIERLPYMWLYCIDIWIKYISYILWQGVAFNVFEKGLEEVSISWTPPSASETRTLYFV